MNGCSAPSCCRPSGTQWVTALAEFQALLVQQIQRPTASLITGLGKRDQSTRGGERVWAENRISILATF